MIIATITLCIYTFPPWKHPNVKPQLDKETVELTRELDGRIIVMTYNKLEYGWVYPIYRGRDVVCE